MSSLVETKAAAFDRIVNVYRELNRQADFYSKNWVLLAEAIETETRRVDGLQGQQAEGDLTD